MEMNFKRFLSLLLAFVMVLGMFPMTHAHAEASYGTVKLSGITFTGSATSEGDISKVSDGIVNTNGNFWTTGSDNGTLANCYLIANLGQEYVISQVDYTMRYDTGGTGGNVWYCTGNLNNYVLEYSTDNATWYPLTSGNTNNGTTVITFAISRLLKRRKSAKRHLVVVRNNKLYHIFR